MSYKFVPLEEYSRRHDDHDPFYVQPSHVSSLMLDNDGDVKLILISGKTVTLNYKGRDGIEEIIELLNK